MMTKALIIVDLQNDFMPNGPLGVPKSDEIISLANALQQHFDIVVASQDWHPPHHSSFTNHPTGIWPVHCVQHTKGAELVEELHTARISKIIYKGTNPAIDSYSVFFDNDRRQKTDLHHYLQSKQVTDIYLVGVATDYCVKFSALDGVYLDYNVYMIEDTCRGIDLHQGDIVNAMREMKSNGVKIIQSNEIIAQ